MILTIKPIAIPYVISTLEFKLPMNIFSIKFVKLFIALMLSIHIVFNNFIGKQLWIIFYFTSSKSASWMLSSAFAPLSAPG